jgi:hypothetical protein
MKFIATLFVLVFLYNSVLAQEPVEKRSSAIYFEAFGNNLYYGLFYDTRFNQSSKGFGGTIGFGAFQRVSNNASWDQSGNNFSLKTINSNYYSTSLMLNYLWGKGPHCLEAGAGAVFYTARNFGYGFVRGDEDQFSSVFGTMSMMYRLHLPKSIFLRLGWTPFFGMANDGFVFIPYQFGFGVGYAFQ